MSAEHIVAQGYTRDVAEEIVGDLMEIEVILDDRQSLFGMADIDF